MEPTMTCLDHVTIVRASTLIFQGGGGGKIVSGGPWPPGPPPLNEPYRQPSTQQTNSQT